MKDVFKSYSTTLFNASMQMKNLITMSAMTDDRLNFVTRRLRLSERLGKSRRPTLRPGKKHQNLRHMLRRRLVTLTKDTFSPRTRWEQYTIRTTRIKQ